MVQFYRAAKKDKANKKAVGTVNPSEPLAVESLTIDSVDGFGQGVCKNKAGITFVAGALPGEQVEAIITEQRKVVRYAKTKQVESASDDRVTPFCQYFGECGGCQLQHAQPTAMLAYRQRALDSYWQQQLSAAVPWQTPIAGQSKAYRRRARLSIDSRNLAKLKIGFRADKSQQVIDIHECPILTDKLSALITPLKQELQQHESTRHIGHITLTQGDNTCEISVHMTRQPSTTLVTGLQALAQSHVCNLSIWASEQRLIAEHVVEPLKVAITDSLFLQPNSHDFMQVNGNINRLMITQALAWLEVTNNDNIADLFCGLGNFSLALAQQCQQVLAIEGVANMVQRGQQNALAQGIDNIAWHHHDLQNLQLDSLFTEYQIDKALLDPSREGALAACKQIAKNQKLATVVYVSCNPTTFMRDAQILLAAGLQLSKVNLIEMFPYTKHIELMALFTRQ